MMIKRAHQSLWMGVITTLMFFSSSGKAFAEGDVLKELSENSSSESFEVVKPPDGTLGPVTLKASLQKTEVLPLTLEAVLDLANGQNITVKLEDERVEQRKLEYQYRLSELLPDIEGAYRQSRFVGAVQIFGGQNVDITRTTYQPQLSANYTIYSGGQNFFEIRASKKRFEAQRDMLEETRQDTLKQAALAYYDLQQAYWLRGIALQSIKEADEQVKITKGRFENGVGLKLDVLQAETILANRKQDALRAENAIAKASQNLVQILNMDLAVDIVPASLDSTVRQILPKGTPFSDWVQLAKTNHPKLQALRQLRDATRMDVKAAQASVLPKIDIATYMNGTGPSLSGLGLTRFAGVTFSTNLLDNMGLGIRTRVKQAKSFQSQAELTILQAERILEENLANSWVDLETLESQVAIAKEGLGFAKAAYQQALGRLKAGVGTNLDLEASMTRLTQARTNLADAFLNYNKTQVMLLSNLGKISVTTLTQGYPADGTHALKP